MDPGPFKMDPNPQQREYRKRNAFLDYINPLVINVLYYIIKNLIMESNNWLNCA